jgi:DNA-binding transcriptional ArsR family regulator
MKKNKLDVKKMERSLDKAYKLVNAIANKDRILLLCQLNHGEKNVSQLAEETKIKQPTLSQQIGILKRAKLIASRREGKNIYYSITNLVALEIMNILYQNYCEK